MMVDKLPKNILTKLEYASLTDKRNRVLEKLDSPICVSCNSYGFIFLANEFPVKFIT